MKTNQVGFTMVEMMAVVVVVALVASFALVGFGKTKDKTAAQNEAVETVSTAGMTAIQIAKKERTPEPGEMQQEQPIPQKETKCGIINPRALKNICSDPQNGNYEACCP